MTTALAQRSRELEAAASAFHADIDNFGSRMTHDQFAGLNTKLESLTQAFSDLLIKPHEKGTFGTSAACTVSSLRERINQMRPESLNKTVHIYPQGCSAEDYAAAAARLTRQGTVQRRASVFENGQQHSGN